MFPAEYFGRKIALVEGLAEEHHASLTSASRRGDEPNEAAHNERQSVFEMDAAADAPVGAAIHGKKGGIADGISAKFHAMYDSQFGMHGLHGHISRAARPASARDERPNLHQQQRHLLNQVSIDMAASEQQLKKEASMTREKPQHLVLNQRVRHAIHGVGVVTKVGSGTRAVQFDNGETHKFGIASWSKLLPISIEDAGAVQLHHLVNVVRVERTSKLASRWAQKSKKRGSADAGPTHQTATSTRGHLPSMPSIASVSSVEMSGASWGSADDDAPSPAAAEPAAPATPQPEARWTEADPDADCRLPYVDAAADAQADAQAAAQAASPADAPADAPSERPVRRKEAEPAAPATPPVLPSAPAAEARADAAAGCHHIALNVV